MENHETDLRNYENGMQKAAGYGLAIHQISVKERNESNSIDSIWPWCPFDTIILQ